MAADCIADGDYLGKYSCFFAEFNARVNPDDQLPVKVNVYDVSESELVGEIISVTLQYLNRIYCPPSLQSYIARLVIQAIKSTCKKQPQNCGLRQQEKTYAPLKLMQAVTNEVNEICRRYLDNSRLALLPPPSSTPQVTVGAIRNARRKMEDRHMILHDLNTMFNKQDDNVVDYYAVFDGHGGQDAAAYCATHLHQYLVESEYYPTDPEHALRDAFSTTDAQFIAKSNTQKLSGGTTAVCALLMNKKLYIAWVGDSMASLVSRGNVKQLVNPHRPTRGDEYDRIKNLGGFILHCGGVPRVNGFLSISRAIGDVQYKPFISSEPEVRCIPLDGTEDFLIIACDGLWDHVDQRTAALRVYRQVLQNPNDLKSVHQALLQSAKRGGSLDNITVIVVFLTPPIEIASRSPSFLTHLISNGLSLNNMDPNNAISSDHDEFDVQPSYINQQLYQIGDDIGSYLKNPAVCRGIGKNGKYDDDEYDYTDIGPETDVDAGEDVHGNNYPLATSSSLEPTPENEKASPVEAKKLNDDGKNDNDYSCDNANVCPADSVANEGDIYDRVRPSEKDVRGADDETPRDNDDEARVGTADTHTVVDDDESPSSPRAAKRQHELIVADNVADSEDSEDEWDFYRVDPNKQESAATAVPVDKSCKDIEEQSTLESEFVKNRPEIASKVEEDIKYEKLEKDISSELIDINVSDKSSEPQKDQILLNFQDDKKDQDNMDFQLNPEAAEFVPSPPLRNNNRNFLQDIAISGSPLKQTQAMDDISIPSQSEFDKEMSCRPKEIGEEFSHDEHTNLQNNGSQNMDTSEISSTKVEVGDDESIINVMSASHWQGTNTPRWVEKADDDTETDSDESEIMETCEPSSPKSALNNASKKKVLKDQDIDLNAVHMLDDSSDGAELVSTPPRSPEPYANDNRAHTPFSEDKNLIDALCASTPQLPDDVLSAVSSEVSSEATATRPVYESKASKALFGADQDPLAKEAARISPGASLEDFHISAQLSAEERKKNDSSIDLKNSVKELGEEHAKLTEDEDKEKKLCKIEDDIEKFFIVPHNCSQKLENEIMEFEAPKAVPDSTTYSNSNNYSSSNKNNQNLFDLETPLYKNLHLDSALEKEQLNYHADLVTDVTNAKDPFTEIVKQEPEISESTNWMKQPENTTNNSSGLKFSFENNPFAESTEQKVEMFYNKDKDGSVESAKPDPTADFNPFNSIQKFNAEDELHHNQIFEGHVPVETTTIDKPVELTDKKTAELTPTIDVLEEKPASDGASLKEEKIEPQETAIASSRDIATIDISKEAAETTETVGIAAVATAAAAAIAMKAKAAPTTSIAKRSTKPATTKATASATKTVTKSIPTSPSKTTTAATRAASAPSAQAAAKKSATSTTPRSKQLDGSNKPAISGTSGKTTATKTTTTAVKTTSTLTKTGLSPRVSSGITKPKTSAVSSKVNSGAPIEKKSTLSGDAKPINKPATARATSASPRTITGTTARTTLAKTSSATTKTSASSITLKQKPASSTSAPRAALASKPATTGVNGAPRPRTVPTSGTTKPREIVGRTMSATTTKSPLIDKQSKETVNKQISRSGASAPKLTNRSSVPNLGVTKIRALPAKPASALPAKKPLGSKTAPKSAAVTKRVSSNENKVLQNGIAKEDVTQAAVITTTTKPEDDVPRKDASPVNVPTDNQLIAN
ncbi:hypothetical protein PUN28_004166 [Cardiocondyla obscurior]|uniref:PPM-type phosphatase domain-containing protein n=1 Tax=Cardiocondyla obscurior TaxID=286306 RepID=A0AAW2GPV1_9HYME